MSSTAVEGWREWKNMVKDCEIGERVNQDKKIGAKDEGRKVNLKLRKRERNRL